MCLIPSITQFESSTLTSCEIWKTTIALDLSTDMNAIKDYASQSLSDSDAPTICLRFMGDYDPIVLGWLISKFYNFFVINSYKNSNYKHFLVKLTLK